MLYYLRKNKGGLMFVSKILVLILSTVISSYSFADKGKFFDHAITVIFENTNYSNAIRQPFLKKLADQGALFSNFSALTHPSQGNYIALTSGSLNGVLNDKNVDINSTNIIDLLEAKKLTWKVYAEDYPGNCFTGNVKGYVRKHNPFISYLNIQKNLNRCSNIVNASQFDMDIKNGSLPNYVFYIPNLNNDGHDTNVTFADNWYSQKFSSLVKDPQLMKNTILVTTFDESGVSLKNQIYTSIVGGPVKPGTFADSLNTYSLLKLFEENWSLEDLGRSDKTAVSIPPIWL